MEHTLDVSGWQAFKLGFCALVGASAGTLAVGAVVLGGFAVFEAIGGME